MAAIIKADAAGSNSRDIQHVTFNFDDMSGQAGVYLDQVRREAEKIIANAKQQGEQLRVQAAQQGRQQAIEAAKKSLKSEIEQRLKTLTPALQQAAGEVLNSKQQWMSQWEKNVVQLAIAIAQRVIRREVANNPEISLQWLREALELAGSAGKLTLRLHPGDVETLGDSAREIAAAVAGLSESDVVADEAVSPGGCVVTTEFGAIDQQVEAQLARIGEELA